MNVRGDDQADRRVHGGPDKAVYSYAVEDYRWWTGQLGRDVGPGTFGENLMTSGVDLPAAVIGERWAVGGAVLEARASSGSPASSWASAWATPASCRASAMPGGPGPT